MAEVALFVYDLSNGMARQMSLALTGRQIDGIWHTSVVCFGVEVFFGQGISITRPGTSHHGQPSRQIPMGKTQIDQDTYFEYIDQVRGTYTAERYHLLDFNCNTFTNDVVGFLTGGSIPREIRDLPADFLSTPFGANLRPMIDSMFRSVDAPGLPPNVSTADVASQVQAGHAPSMLHSVVGQATMADVGEASRTLSSHLTVCTNQASFRAILDDNRAVVAMFTSESCPPCRVIKPVFESLAADAKHGAYVLVDTASGATLARSEGITATPTFRFYLRGQLRHEQQGANARELRTQVDTLLYQAYPPHPHSKLDLPRLRAIAHQTVTYTSKPKFEALLARLHTSRLSPASQAIYRDSIVPFLASSSEESCTPELIEAWLAAHTEVLKMLPAADWFPALDLVRLALLDPRCGDPLVLVPFLTATSELLQVLPPQATALTALRMMTNARAAKVADRTNGRIDLPLLINGLLAEEANIRTAAAGLSFMLAKWARSTSVDEDWETEVASALVEALGREREGEVVHRLAAALGLLLLDSPHHQSLAQLLSALQAPETLKAQGQALKMSDDAKGLVQETVQVISASLR